MGAYPAFLQFLLRVQVCDGDHFRDSADQALARFKGDVFKQITDEIERRLKEAVDAAEAKYEGRSTFDREASAEKIDVCGKLLAAI